MIKEAESNNFLFPVTIDMKYVNINDIAMKLLKPVTVGVITRAKSFLKFSTYLKICISIRHVKYTSLVFLLLCRTKFFLTAALLHRFNLLQSSLCLMCWIPETCQLYLLTCRRYPTKRLRVHPKFGMAPLPILVNCITRNFEVVLNQTFRRILVEYQNFLSILLLLNRRFRWHFRTRIWICWWYLRNAWQMAKFTGLKNQWITPHDLGA